MKPPEKLKQARNWPRPPQTFVCLQLQLDPIFREGTNIARSITLAGWSPLPLWWYRGGPMVRCSLTTYGEIDLTLTKIIVVARATPFVWLPLWWYRGGPMARCSLTTSVFVARATPFVWLPLWWCRGGPMVRCSLTIYRNPDGTPSSSFENLRFRVRPRRPH